MEKEEQSVGIREIYVCSINEINIATPIYPRTKPQLGWAWLARL
jgi:hypothetical protein